MRGRINEFSMQQSSGAIVGEDGYRYDFSVSEWRSDDPPARDTMVEFTAAEDGRTALDVYSSVVDEPQRQERSIQRPDERHAQGGSQSEIRPEQHPPLPDNYLVWAIVVTILCCLPTGIVAIVYSAKVNGLHRNGQYQDAKDAAKASKNWIYGSVALGIGIGIMFFISALTQGY